MRNGNEIDKNNFKSIYGILFFGVPNRGIRIEHWLRVVKGQPNEGLVRMLGPDSGYLRELNQSFRSVFVFLDSVFISVYETERTRVAKEESGKWARTGDYEILVPIGSATDSCSMGQVHDVLPIQRNHSDLVEFSSRWDENYRLIVSHLEDFSETAVGVIQKRFLMGTNLKFPVQGWYCAGEGRYTIAEEMNRRVLDGEETVIGREHPDDLALALENPGKFKSAKAMNQWALDEKRRVPVVNYGPNVSSKSKVVGPLRNNSAISQHQVIPQGLLCFDGDQATLNQVVEKVLQLHNDTEQRKTESDAETMVDGAGQTHQIADTMTGYGALLAVSVCKNWVKSKRVLAHLDI